MFVFFVYSEEMAVRLPNDSGRAVRELLEMSKTLSEGISPKTSGRVWSLLLFRYLDKTKKHRVGHKKHEIRCGHTGQ